MDVIRERKMNDFEINSVNEKWKKEDQKIENDKKENVQSTSQAFLVLIFVFITSVFSLLMVYYRFPELESDEIQYMKLPQNIDDAKNLGKVLSHYKDRYFFTVLGGYFVMYILYP
ncbi:transmembrane protein 41B-like [Centruroides sculpturatus]|uniref:transmembrane protein 41B-like n=1 Tax=Centruroides sculpturatus TaxID=218467 RepID=UPI000C6EEC83|nr:transmembrane protein 41B-like [Centruroides sculpturatus]